MKSVSTLEIPKHKKEFDTVKVKTSKPIIINNEPRLVPADEDTKLTSSNAFVGMSEDAGFILASISNMEMEVATLTSKLTNPKLKEVEKVRIQLQIAKLHAQIREQKKKVLVMKPEW